MATNSDGGSRSSPSETAIAAACEAHGRGSQPVNAERGATRAAGLLYLLGMVAGILSVAPSVDSQDYLVAAAADGNQIIRAAFFQLLMVAAYVGIAIVMYPLLERHGQRLALGFFGFRIIAGTFIFVGVILLLLLLAVSRQFVGGGAPDVSYLQTLGGLLRTGRDLVNHVAMILSLSFGGLLFYALLFRARLVPRWLSAWGLVGATLTIVASLAVMAGLVEVVTTTYLTMNVPMALQELVLAIWLIAKGFESTPTDKAACG